MRTCSRVIMTVLVLSMFGFVSTANAFPNVSDCMGCHGGFRSGSPSLHDQHSVMINDCQDCHQNGTFGGLKTNNSGNYANNGCNGCHVVDGLAKHHNGAGITACAGCHSVTATIGENELPFYYTGGRSSIVNTCRLDTANGGEDLDGNGFGLDNDGDGAYDAADTDCDGIVPTVEETWSTFKVLFDSGV